MNRIRTQYFNEHKANGSDGNKIIHTFNIPFIDYDVPITSDGWEQARITGEYLRTKEISFAITSPMVRTRQTLEGVINSWESKPKIIINELIKEVNAGERYKVTSALFEQMFPGELAKKNKDRYNYRPPNGESYADVLLRVFPAAQEILKQAEQENLLVVSHGTCIRILRQIIENLTPNQFLALPENDEPRNCSITHYVVQNRNATLQSYNICHYIPKVLRTAYVDE